MAIVIAPYSLDTELKSLLDEVEKGKMQLPEFQRSWTWDDNRIRGILASLSQGYPMGAIMRLQYGSEAIRFKYRTIEGVKKQDVVPDFLVLDGQQRLTSMYNRQHTIEREIYGQRDTRKNIQTRCTYKIQNKEHRTSTHVLCRRNPSSNNRKGDIRDGKERNAKAQG